MSAWWLPDAVTVDGGSVIARASQLPSRTSAMKDATARPVSALEVIVRAGSIHAVIGDVAGHGPDEAAIGAALRIAWRALTLAGFEDAKAMHQLDRMLCAERGGQQNFRHWHVAHLEARTRRSHHSPRRAPGCPAAQRE